MDQGVWGVIPQVEGIPSQPTNTVQATARYLASLVLHSHRSGDQFGPPLGARSGAKIDIFCKQIFIRAWGEIPGHRKGSDSGVFNAKTSPLLLEIHRNRDDKPAHSQGLIETRCGRTNGALGGWAIRVWCAVWTKMTYQRPGLCWFRSRALLGSHAPKGSRFQMGHLRRRVLQPIG